ncbi:MAG: hypothetical protein WD334_12135 [Chitinophagales bacterium]
MPLFNIKTAFFKAPKYQRFNFIPRYYDPDREEFEKRVRMAEMESKLENTEEQLRKLKIKNSFKRAREKSMSLNAKHEIKKSRIRFAIILAILVATAAWIIFSV